MTVLDQVCGKANEQVFMGFTDLFQSIANALIPDFWPFSVMEDIFNRIFDRLQEQMKPIAYKQGARMGREIERKVTAWIQAEFDKAMTELQKARDQALAEIQAADNKLREHSAKIQNLVERVAQLEGREKELDALRRRVI